MENWVVQESTHGNPPYWKVEVDPRNCTAHLVWEPELVSFPKDDFLRREIHQACQALEKALHDLALAS